MRVCGLAPRTLCGFCASLRPTQDPDGDTHTGDTVTAGQCFPARGDRGKGQSLEASRWQTRVTRSDHPLFLGQRNGQVHTALHTAEGLAAEKEREGRRGPSSHPAQSHPARGLGVGETPVSRVLGTVSRQVGGVHLRAYQDPPLLSLGLCISADCCRGGNSSAEQSVRLWVCPGLACDKASFLLAWLGAPKPHSQFCNSLQMGARRSELMRFPWGNAAASLGDH